MKKILFLFTIGLILYSCSTIQNISGKKFIYKSPNRELVLFFENDSLCSLKNTFYCDDIDNKYKEITIKATYKKQSNMIVLKNLTCEDSTCKYAPTMDIPVQVSNKCVFLNKDNRNGKTIFDGRTYQSGYDKYGLIPNIDVDTMYIHKNQILFVKKRERGNFGFLFKYESRQ